MDVASKLSVLFEAPFWIGLYERTTAAGYEVCKITFGAEPKDGEVWLYILNNWRNLQFSPALDAEKNCNRRINPKRLQRRISNELQRSPIGTKAQQALKLQHEQAKAIRKHCHREAAEAEQQRRFALKQEKKKAKHRGR